MQENFNFKLLHIKEPKLGMRGVFVALWQSGGHTTSVIHMLPIKMQQGIMELFCKVCIIMHDYQCLTEERGCLADCTQRRHHYLHLSVSPGWQPYPSPHYLSHSVPHKVTL